MAAFRQKDATRNPGQFEFDFEPFKFDDGLSGDASELSPWTKPAPGDDAFSPGAEDNDSLPWAQQVYSGSDAAIDPGSILSTGGSAIPAGYDAEVTFISGVTASGTIAAQSFSSWKGDNPATYNTTAIVQKFGAAALGSGGGQVTYYFDPASAWTATEKSAFVSAMSLWSSVANITFAETTTASTAGFNLKRGTDGGAYAWHQGTVPTVGSTNAGRISSDGSAYVSIDTSVTSFGSLGSAFGVIGGYPWQVLIHEIGHVLGLGHGGAYNGNVNSATQQYSAFDNRQWTVMSYINPSDSGAKYYSQNPSGGATWGSSGGWGRVAVTPMMLDILAIQRLYGAQNAGPLSGGQTYGFNTTISGPIRDFFNFSTNAAPIVTLYSSGRNNTLDASGFAQASRVSLVDGTFSNLGGLVNNVGIAQGTIIEHFVGGSGIDDVTGNGFNNVIRGNAGADSINGAGGVDFAVYNVARSGATVTRNRDGSVQVGAGIDGSDRLTNVEWAQFTDGRVWVGAQKNDSNNDGRSDLLWRNVNGEAAIWMMDNGAITGGATLANPGAQWRLVGSGDFNGDRKADLVWQDTTTGQVAEWQLNGASIAAGAYVATPGTAWKAVGAADFNADGLSDIALQNTDGSVAVWLMNGTSLASGAVIANPGSAWRLRATADFDADGAADMLLQHDNGTVAVWRMNGTSLLSGAILANPGTSWHVMGTGDFNRDGRSDIVWENDGGSVAIWSMQDAATIQTGPTTGVVTTAPGWKVGGVGDFNGDNVSDLMLQNTGSGQVVAWAMNGSNLTPTGALLANPGTSWFGVA